MRPLPEPQEASHPEHDFPLRAEPPIRTGSVVTAGPLSTPTPRGGEPVASLDWLVGGENMGVGDMGCGRAASESRGEEVRSWLDPLSGAHPLSCGVPVSKMYVARIHRGSETAPTMPSGDWGTWLERQLYVPVQRSAELPREMYTSVLTIGFPGFGLGVRTVTVAWRRSLGSSGCIALRVSVPPRGYQAIPPIPETPRNMFSKQSGPRTDPLASTDEDGEKKAPHLGKPDPKLGNLHRTSYPSPRSPKAKASGVLFELPPLTVGGVAGRTFDR
ncbi:hypothetical protein B2J93_9309 [Marssonina coronariae]|uniref:Uncharacterized protein n=1 Tax=Diplocarpon coronariae TaxID=2795749 RepID=A0A218Z839_9HELO|nr:hypothetical protein B2J93_9309 [Marssonina coronariae]